MITGIIMASGFSKRMNKDKLTLDFKGISIVERVIKAVKQSNIDEIILVYREEKIKEIAIKNRIKAVYNDKAQLGQSESIKLGINASSIETKGFMFFVGDQPFLEPCTINKLIDTFNKKNTDIVVPIYKDKRGNPVIFSFKLKDELLKIEGDKGGKSIITKKYNDVEFVFFDNNIARLDIDTWDEYLKWR
ncbi:molybdenum cofactor cytidylyltransferase [Tepidibacter aestuarii]|uniref:molybdenum cofactor cytidylyltransferase n=1 Tax=Tepidibacter aestuarii TaxID=2925782 RepID=UPI0020BE139C|nr:molybdenum cofactor cytidylyltransferase [Tepidibacter aestuarii]CAH2212505.1 molybdenum cofactor cytidylyltransferase [Tepidibacter aestuarii]